MTNDERKKRVADDLHVTLNNYKNSYLTQDEVVDAAIAASDATLKVTLEVVGAINSVLQRFSGITYNQYLCEELMAAALAAMRGSNDA